MKSKLIKYTKVQLGAAGFMILALLWLTVSAPFVYAGQQKIAKFAKSVNTDNSNSANEEESSNPFSGSEEKVPSNSTLSEEYLHDHHEAEMVFIIQMQYHKTHDAGTYNAFHGELLVPPPNQA